MRRRASIYITVLGISTAVTIIGLSALFALRSERRTAETAGDFAQARWHARSAIEVGIQRIRDNVNWRTAIPGGTWEADRPLGIGSFSLFAADPQDADLTDFDGDPLVLTGLGVQGKARYKLQVSLNATLPPLSCLETSAHVGNDILVDSLAIVQGSQIISANDTIQAVGLPTVNPNMEAVNGFLGTLVPGLLTSGVPPRDMPDPSRVFNYYLGQGSTVSPPTPNLEAVLLSPAVNPYGATNAQGIYVIDCQGADFHIMDSRIVGTVVLLNAGANSQVGERVNWEPAVANYPALLVSNTVHVQLGGSALSEVSTINFNPPGTPYQGAEDTDLLDSYPSKIKGLVYASNDVYFSVENAMEGVVIAGNTLHVTGTLNLAYQAVFHDNPPPGFHGPALMSVVQGSWQQVVD